MNYEYMKIYIQKNGVSMFMPLSYSNKQNIYKSKVQSSANYLFQKKIL